jgi:hypothetical protein
MYGRQLFFQYCEGMAAYYMQCNQRRELMIWLTAMSHHDPPGKEV